MYTLFIISSFFFLSCCATSVIGLQLNEADKLLRQSSMPSNDTTLLSSSSSSSTNTYAQAIDYGKTHPTRGGESWNGWCASLMWRAGNLPESSAFPSAIDAYHHSTIISTDSTSAPAGAFHWWDIGSDGHVAMSMGDNVAMMACDTVVGGLHRIYISVWIYFTHWYVLFMLIHIYIIAFIIIIIIIIIIYL